MNELQKFLDSIPANSNELIDYNGQEFYNWQAEKLGNDLFINDADRAVRCYDAADEGCDGSTHAEHIEDFREWEGVVFEGIEKFITRAELPEEIEAAILLFSDQQRAAVEKSLDDLEEERQFISAG